MTAFPPLTSAPLGFTGDSPAPDAVFFNVRQTVISQYANSPIILAIIDVLGTAIDLQQRLDDFLTWVWDVETAQGFGLDILGRIVGVARALHVSTEAYLGWSQSSDAVPFGQGVFYGAGNLTPNYKLTDDAYRRLILAKAALNITNSSAPAINAILMALFPGYGNVFARDNGDMTMTYVFGAAPSKVDYAIVTQSGALPKPAGVAVSLEHP